MRLLLAVALSAGALISPDVRRVAELQCLKAALAGKCRWRGMVWRALGNDLLLQDARQLCCLIIEMRANGWVRKLISTVRAQEQLSNLTSVVLTRVPHQSTSRERYS